MDHTHLFNGRFSRTTRVCRYQKGKTNLDFTEARDSEWQWHQLGHMQVCTSLQTDNHASTPPLSFLQAVCPSCHSTNSVKALKALYAESTCIFITPTAEFLFRCFIVHTAQTLLKCFDDYHDDEFTRIPASSATLERLFSSCGAIVK